MALRTSRGSAPRWPWSRRLRRTVLTSLTVVGLAVAVGACSSSSATSSAPAASASGKVGGSLTVWVDSVRLPVAQAYAKAHPNVHVHIVTFDGDANGATSLQAKIQLWNRTGSGWPDVVFASPTDVTWASAPTNPSAQAFAAPVDQLVPASTLQGFATGSLSPCQVDGHTYCLRNDIAQVVTWYNKKLMDQWGYQVPTTWEQYQALGEKVAAQHPGYVIGAVGDTNSQESYFWSSQCPAQQLVGNNTLKVDLTSSDCTRMANLLDPLIADKSVSTQGFFTQGFDGSKVLAAVGPSWYGQYLFNSAFKTPAGEIAASLPLTWDGQSSTYTGNVGGGIWMISSHSQNLKAATALTTWLTTSDDNLSDAPTYPAYVAGAKAWLANPTNKDYFADDVSNVFLTAANEVWTGWSNTKFSDATPWSNAVLPALTAGQSMTDALPAWQTAIVNEAKSVGYTVVTQ